MQSIKPVWMMSPMSLAQFIGPGSLDFDVVLMDEASQIRPVEAFGAIVRGGSW
jgi:superfamily I DNA and/or RNA helicase